MSHNGEHTSFNDLPKLWPVRKNQADLHNARIAYCGFLETSQHWSSHLVLLLGPTRIGSVEALGLVRLHRLHELTS